MLSDTSGDATAHETHGKARRRPVKACLARGFLLQTQQRLESLSLVVLGEAGKPDDDRVSSVLHALDTCLQVDASRR